jgi:hypothetical protein
MWDSLPKALRSELVGPCHNERFGGVVGYHICLTLDLIPCTQKAAGSSPARISSFLLFFLLLLTVCTLICTTCGKPRQVITFLAGKDCRDGFNCFAATREKAVGNLVWVWGSVEVVGSRNSGRA